MSTARPAEATDTFGRVDVVCMNAGTNLPEAPLAETTDGAS